MSVELHRYAGGLARRAKPISFPAQKEIDVFSHTGRASVTRPAHFVSSLQWDAKRTVRAVPRRAIHDARAAATCVAPARIIGTINWNEGKRRVARPRVCTRVYVILMILPSADRCREIRDGRPVTWMTFAPRYASPPNEHKEW